MTDFLDRLTAALGDRYRIEREIGAGGMATVYLAHDVKHDRKVAVKVLRPELAAVLGAERFLNEIKVTANLDHPHILPLFDSGEAGGFLYYVMPYVEGESLRDRLRREKQLPVADVLSIVRAVASALDHAHARGVIHRDIKPENILLREDAAVVTDFGIALAVSAVAGERLTETGISVGTPEYMSPEQATGERQLDARSDVYSLGAVVYEMLAGEPPHSGGTLQALVSKILTETPRSIRDGRPRIPHGVDQAVLRALDRVPADRYPTAGTFVSALEAPEALPGRSHNLLRAILGTAAATAVVTATLVYAILGSERPTTQLISAAEGSHTPLTATGDAWGVELSPNGETVAYLTAEGLVAQDLGGGYPNLLLSTKPATFQWLPSGSGVAFSLPIDSTSFGIYAVPRMGGDVTPLHVETVTSGQAMAGFRVLSDSAYLIVRILEPVTVAPWLLVRGSGSERGIDVPSDIMRLWDAAVSPDGAWIAYIGERGDRTTVLATLSLDGARHNVIVEGRQELAKWDEISVNPLWPAHRTLRWPSQETLFFRKVTAQGLDVYTVRIDPASGAALGEPSLVLPRRSLGANFDVSRDRHRVVYTAGVIRTQVQIFRLDPRMHGAPIEQRTITQGTARHVKPRISPDGKRIAYVRRTGGSEDIYVAPLAGGNATRVNVLATWRQVRDLRWSGEGDRLAVLAETQAGPRILIVSLSDARVEELEVKPPRGEWLTWSPDGRFIALGAADDSHIVLHDLVTGAERRFFEELNGELVQWWFSPDVTHLLANSIFPAGLWVQPLEGGAPRLVTPKSYPSYPLRWSQDGTIYIFDPAGAILTVPWTGGPLQPYAEVPSDCTGSWSATMGPTAEYFACSVDEHRESDIWVIEDVGPEPRTR